MDSTARNRLGQVLRKNLDEVVEQLFINHFDNRLIESWELNVPEQEKREALRADFIRPLIYLLIDYCSSGDEAILAVYLDERLRYAPHRLPIAERKKFHSELVSKDRSALTSLFANESELADTWTELHDPLVQTSELKEMRVLAVGDCLFNELRVFAPHAARKIGVELDIRCIYFSASYTGGMDHTTVLDHIDKEPIDLVLFSFFSYDALPGYSRIMTSADAMSAEEIKEQCKMMVGLANEFIDNVRKATSIPFAVHNVSGLPLRRWRKKLPFLSPHSIKQRLALNCLNDEINLMVEAKPNTLLIDELELARRKGYRSSSKDAVSQRKYKGMFHTSRFGQYLTETYNHLFSAYQQLGKCKVLLVDFDNTLWHGVMADGEVEQYIERQKLLLALKDVGIVLVAISKNSPENIRWDEMEIKPDDFALLKISWEPKVKSILEAITELNLGKDSFVLLDDNRHERAQVENEIPDVHSLDPDDELTWEKLRMIFEFPNTMETEEAKNRTMFYQQQAQRQKAVKADVDYASMMRKLELWYKYYAAGSGELSRIHELVSRTNQFNTTTRRYTADELKQMITSDDHEVMVGEVGDKFGGLGIVAVIIIRYQSDMAILDSFIMSCRAMGFGLENQLLYRVEQDMYGKGVGKLIGEFISSDRNQPCENLYRSNEFVEHNDGWVKDLQSGELCRKVDWFQEKTR